LIWEALATETEPEIRHSKRNFDLVKFEIALRINAMFAKIVAHYNGPILSFYEKAPSSISTGRVTVSPTLFTFFS
jgi:hypothetical protein